MGYGTIARNGAAHGSKAQTFSSLQTQNLYTEPEGVRFQSMAKAIKKNFKIQVYSHMPEGEF